MDAIPEADPLTPEARARDTSIRGIAVRIGGHDWLFADNFSSLGDVWDRLYEENVTRAKYSPHDVQRAAARLLLKNYDLTLDEAVSLITAVDPQALVEPVEAVIFGRTDLGRTRTDWILASLYANGIDPTRVPPEMANHVMDILVETRRTVPAAQFIDKVAEFMHYNDRLQEALLSQAANSMSSSPISGEWPAGATSPGPDSASGSSTSRPTES